MSKKDEALKLALEHAKRDERHMNNAETRYWCRMYRDIAEKAIEALAEQTAHTITKEKLQQIVASYVDSPMLVEELWHSLKPAQQQEPVAWMFQHGETGRTLCVDAQQVKWGFEERNPRYQKIAPLYTSPPASKPWVGLTDEERAAIFGEFGLALMPVRKVIAEEIEAKLKEKNNG